MVSLISEKRQLENVDLSAACTPKCRRRKVSAVRDFPPLCGPNAMHISMQNEEFDGGVHTVDFSAKNVEYGVGLQGDPNDMKEKGLLEYAVESQNCDIPVSLSSVGNAAPLLATSKILEDRTKELSKLPTDVTSNGLLGQPTNEEPKLSENLQNPDNESTSKDELHDMPKDTFDVMVESPISSNNSFIPGLKEILNDISDMAVDGACVPSSLLPHHPIPSSVARKERTYPPSRKVSAVRDFPRGCGPNLQLLGEAEGKCPSQGKEDVYTCEEGARRDESQIEAQLKADNDNRNEDVCGRSENGVHFESDNGACVEKQGFDREDEGNAGASKDVLDKEFIVYTKDKGKKKKSLGILSSNLEVQKASPDGFGNEFNMIVVLGLMAAPNCPWKQGKERVKSSPGMTDEAGSKRKKHDSARQCKRKCSPKQKANNAEKTGERAKVVVSYLNETQTEEVLSVRDEEESMGRKHDSARRYKRKCSAKKSTENAEKSGERSQALVPYLKETETDEIPCVSNEGNSSENEESPNDYQLVPRMCHSDVSPIPLGPDSSAERGIRSKVRETLRLFQAIVRKLLQGEETKTKDGKKLKDQENSKKRIDLQAGKILKDHGKYINTGKSIVGSVPGVEVGDIFNYRMELMIIGLHRPPQAGIDYLNQGGRLIAASIVASGGYANDVDSADVLKYTGQGGNLNSGDKQPEDQKLERGNLALKNSIDAKNAVRVIRGLKETKPPETPDGRPKTVMTYTYDGLYIVEKYWQDIGPHGKLVFMFELRRLPGQPELAWKEVKKSKKFKVREGRCVDDISEGKEAFPICAVNTLDDEKPPSFTYITRMMYPNWCQPIPPRGCNCKNGCSDSEHCACAVRNGGEIPYNYSGAIVEAKPLVYECGPCCKCPPSCHNRVSQGGIKLPLEIFKTDSRGWGVRSLCSIPSGSFICEYIGELLDDKEAEQRTGSDEYLFDIGQNYNDPTLWGDLSALMPDVASSTTDVVENIGFTIDAASYGNIGRFVNHSCSPNLYAQNVLYDHDDKRIPHIMLFAAENIPPLQELTYHYNYTIDQVLDSDGNIKKKSCHCGSSECTGRMY